MERTVEATATTSPSGAILASIDAARALLGARLAAQSWGMQQAQQAFAMQRGDGFHLIEELGAALPVAHVDENNAAKIPARVNPAGQSHCLPNVSRAQLAAMMRSFHFRTIREFIPIEAEFLNQKEGR